MMVPIVLINDQHPGAFVHSVMIGNVEGVRVVAEHLVGLGHRRIAYIGDQYGYQSDTERFAGYREALEAARIPVASGAGGARRWQTGGGHARHG